MLRKGTKAKDCQPPDPRSRKVTSIGAGNAGKKWIIICRTERRGNARRKEDGNECLESLRRALRGEGEFLSWRGKSKKSFGWKKNVEKHAEGDIRGV